MIEKTANSRILLGLCVVSFCVVLFLPLPFLGNAQITRPIGINLSYVADYSTELVFTDAFRQCREWISSDRSPIKTWAERTPANYYTQAKFGGAAWEYVVQLANESRKDIWINIPHKADDASITNLANLLKQFLHANARIYLEYSNEIWNSFFSQHEECAEMAQMIGIPGQPWERAWKFTAKRSADVFHLFEKAFGGTQRLVRIIPSQAANSWLTEELITYFNDRVFIQSDATVHRFQVYNGLGQLLIFGQDNTIDLSQLPDGLFLVKIDRQVFRVVKNAGKGG